MEAAVRNAFEGMDGVDRVVIFGSWAARRLGVPGLPPNDIDVLVVGSPDAFDTMTAAQEVESVARVPVNPVVIPMSQWMVPDDPMVADIKAGPTVEINLAAVSVGG